MKTYKLLMLAVITLMVSACNSDFKDEISIDENGNTFPTTVAFTASSVSVDETGTSAEISVELIGQALTEDLTVEYALVETGLSAGEDYNFVGGSDLVIPAGEYGATLTVAPIDDETTSSGPQTLGFTITGTTNPNISVGSDSAVARFATLAIIDNDCEVPSIVGDFSVVTVNTSPAGCEGVENTITVAVVSENADGTVTYSLSDVTGGLYLNCYGAADNPGNIVVDFKTVTMTAQPDVVYGGDQFDGTGSIDACGETMTIQWSNGFGDAGTTTFSL